MKPEKSGFYRDRIRDVPDCYSLGEGQIWTDFRETPASAGFPLQRRHWHGSCTDSSTSKNAFKEVSPMHLTKALAALSAGSLLLIGHSALYAQDDPYTDSAQDQQSETTQDQMQDDPTTAQDESQQSDPMDDDMQASTQPEEDTSDTWSAEAETDVQDEQSQTTADVDVEAESDFESDAWTRDEETTADVDVEADVDASATEDEASTMDTYAQTETDDSASASASSSSASGSTDTELEPQVARVDVEVKVDEQKVEELAQIHVEMQKETRELADQMASAESTEDAQDLQAQMVDRQIEVIESHGWTRDEYNAVVDTVNEDPELRAAFIEDVVGASDEAVAQTQTDDPATPEEEDTDW